MSAVHENASVYTASFNKPLSIGALQELPALTPRRRQAPAVNPIPVPETPELSDTPDISQLTAKRPVRRIISSQDHSLFLQSPTYKLILSFVFALSESCVDKKITTSNLEEQAPVIQEVYRILEAVSETVDQNSPADQGTSRFGNPAFRGFIDDVRKNLPKYHASLGSPGVAWSEEASVYLEEAFGSRERIDYGSGHELNFIMWLLCLNRLSLLPRSSFSAVALNVMPKYIQLLRKIQSTYYLEPAGSHGVWGLDDYHFLPFMFGASQLLHHPYIRPLAIHNEIILEEDGDDYMYLDMVRWTVATKTVKGLKWTQPMLDDISGAKDWIKVEQGMRRMFVKEVLGKLPVMQHFLFGTLIPAPNGMTPEEEALTAQDGSSNHVHLGHVGRDDAWGDCCGIKIPSTLAASEDARKRGLKAGLRRVPFD